MDIHIKLTIDDRLVTLARKLPLRSATLFGVLCALSGAVAVMAAPVVRPGSFKAGDRITADAINESFDVVYDELNARVIRNDKTFEVSDCAALKTALAG